MHTEKKELGRIEDRKEKQSNVAYTKLWTNYDRFL